MAGPGRRIDRSFLGEAVIRLSRVFGLGGEVSPQFDSGDRIQPVVLVADATQPGYRGQNLRGFAYCEKVPAVAGNLSKLAVKAFADRAVILDGFTIACGTVPVAATEWRIGVMGFAEADPWVINQTNVRFTERTGPDANGDLAPVFTMPQSGDALEFGLTIAGGVLPATSMIVLPIPVVLHPGGKIIMQGKTTLAQTLHFGFWGRAL